MTSCYLAGGKYACGECDVCRRYLEASASVGYEIHGRQHERIVGRAINYALVAGGLGSFGLGHMIDWDYPLLGAIEIAVAIVLVTKAGRP